jgi:hypothetical protein
MSLNLYFDTEKVEKHESFQPRGPAGQGIPHVFGTGVYRDEKGYHVYSDLDSPISPEFMDMLIGVSLQTYFDIDVKRVRGVYNLGQASGTLDLNHLRDNKTQYLLKLTGPTIESVRKLYRLVRAGNIAPSESWEVEQVKFNPMSWIRRQFARFTTV